MLYYAGTVLMHVNVRLLQGGMQRFDVRRLIDGVVVQLLQYAQIFRAVIKPAGEALLAVIHEREVTCAASDKLRLTVRAGFAAARLLADADNVVEVEYVPALIDLRHGEDGSHRIIDFFQRVQQDGVFFQ